MNSIARLVHKSNSVCICIADSSIKIELVIGRFVKSIVRQPRFTTSKSCVYGDVQHINSFLKTPTHILSLYINVNLPIIFFLLRWVNRRSVPEFFWQYLRYKSAYSIVFKSFILLISFNNKGNAGSVIP